MGAGAPRTRGRPRLREQAVQSPGIKPRPRGVRARCGQGPGPGGEPMGRSSFHTHLAPHPSPEGLSPVGGASLVALMCSVSTALGPALELSPSSHLPSRSRTSRVGLLVCPEPPLTPADPAFGRPQLPAGPTLEPAALRALGCWAGEEGSQRQPSGQAEGLPLIHLQPPPGECRRSRGEVWPRGVYPWAPGPKGVSAPVSTGCQRKFVSRCKYPACLPAGSVLCSLRFNNKRA